MGDDRFESYSTPVNDHVRDRYDGADYTVHGKDWHNARTGQAWHNNPDGTQTERSTGERRKPESGHFGDPRWKTVKGPYVPPVHGCGTLLVVGAGVVLFVVFMVVAIFLGTLSQNQADNRANQQIRDRQNWWDTKVASWQVCDSVSADGWTAVLRRGTTGRCDTVTAINGGSAEVSAPADLHKPPQGDPVDVPVPMTEGDEAIHLVHSSGKDGGWVVTRRGFTRVVVPPAALQIGVPAAVPPPFECPGPNATTEMGWYGGFSPDMYLLLTCPGQPRQVLDPMTGQPPTYQRADTPGTVIPTDQQPVVTTTAPWRPFG